MNDLQKKCAQLPEKPGIYRFLDKTKKIIYVGKARDLKKRVTQYCRNNIVDRKTMALMAQATDIEITITNNENQALLFVIVISISVACAINAIVFRSTILF